MFIPRHDLDAGDQGRLKALQLRWHRRLMQDAVDAVADAQLVFRRLEMNVRGAVLVCLPDDLVDELDDAGFLIALGDFLVRRQIEIERRVVLVQFAERFGANAVIVF